MSPNQPKTTVRTFRIPDEEYEAAREEAVLNGETVTDVVRKSLRDYVRRSRRKRGA